MKFNVRARKKELDSLLSQLVRKLQKNCQWCGTKDNLQCHHIISKARTGNAGRWSLDNVVCLCYVCHIHRMPKESVEYSRFIERWLHDNDLDYDQLKAKFDGASVKFNKEYFDIKKKVLLDLLENV